MSCGAEDHEEGEKDCCKNKKKFYKFDQDQLLQEFEKKTFEFKIVLNAAIPAFNNVFLSLDKKIFQYRQYRPPLIIFDHQVHLQTFLC